MIDVPIPPSVNHLWRILRRGTRTYVARSRQYDAWLEVAVPLLRLGLPAARLPARIRVLIQGGPGWKANRDLDNTLKALMDALVAARCIPTDSTRHVSGIRIDHLPPQPGQQAYCLIGYQEESNHVR